MGLESFTLVTDHKPLVPLMNNKDLSDAPVRCQRLLMRLLRFQATAVHVPGKMMAVADALSRGPLKHDQTDTGAATEKDVELHVEAVRLQWSASDNKLKHMASETEKDEKLTSRDPDGDRWMAE